MFKPIERGVFMVMAMALLLLGLGGCSGFTVDDTAKTHSMIYGRIDMDDSPAEFLQWAVFEQMKPKPKDDDERYVFSNYSHNTFYSEYFKPGGVYQWIRFGGKDVNGWTNTITSYNYKFPKGDRPQFKIGKNKWVYLGAYKIIIDDDKKVWDLKPLKGKKHEIMALKMMRDSISGSNWEPYLEKRLSKLEKK